MQGDSDEGKYKEEWEIMYSGKEWEQEEYCYIQGRMAAYVWEVIPQTQPMDFDELPSTILTWV